ncbi:MAG: sensor domain-containing diguanylate cyclase [Candidatus Omnitrophota bacterium]
MNKSLPCLLTIVLCVASALLLLYPLDWSSPLASSLFLSLPILVIICALCFSVRGVLVSTGVGLFIIFLAGPRFGQQNVISSLALLAIIGYGFYLYCARSERTAQKYRVDADEVEEEKNVVTVELHHAHLENSSLKTKLLKYTALKDLTETLSSVLSLEKTLTIVSDQAFQLINKSTSCLLYLVDQEKQSLSLAQVKCATQTPCEIKTKQGDIFDNWVFKQRTRLMVKDTLKDFRFNTIGNPGEESRGVLSLIAAPLISENKVLGILRLDNTRPDTYDTDDLRLLDIISDLAAVALQTTLLYQRIQKLAITDGLTGLFVHRHFQQRLEEEVSRALWTNSPFAFLMIDIDNFKTYNDKYGHISGDIVLKRIAGLLAKAVGPGDIVARYGGEEFALILVDVSGPEALKTAELIREKIAQEKFVLRREITKVTISGGLSFFPKDANKREDLIKRADLALYKAKSEGKNRVCIM